MSLAQYIARAPLSLERLRYNEHAGNVLSHSTYNPYLGENLKIWYFGLYSSRSRWKWSQ